MTFSLAQTLDYAELHNGKLIMSRQNTIPPLILALLAVVFSIRSPNAFSGGWRQIEFLQKIGDETDTYMVSEQWNSWARCVDSVKPESLETFPGIEVPGVDFGQIIHIHYLSWVNSCDILTSAHLFEVRSRQHPDRFAQFWWVKEAGQNPVIEKEHDPMGLLWIDYNDGTVDPAVKRKCHPLVGVPPTGCNDGSIQVWVGYNGGSW